MGPEWPVGIILKEDSLRADVAGRHLSRDNHGSKKKEVGKRGCPGVVTDDNRKWGHMGGLCSGVGGWG